MLLVRCCVLVSTLALLIGAARAEEPLFTLSDDGTEFTYTARPGDQAGVIAQRFGIPAKDVSGFLASNGITDPTRVPIGHVFRIPNPLASRAAEAAARAGELEREGSELRARLTGLEREVGVARAHASEAEARAGRLARLERLWAWAQGIGVLLVLALGAIAVVAITTARNVTESQRYVQALQSDLEDLRRRALAERQEAGKRILDLEARTRDLSAQLASTRAPVRRPTGTH